VDGKKLAIERRAKHGIADGKQNDERPDDFVNDGQAPEAEPVRPEEHPETGAQGSEQEVDKDLAGGLADPGGVVDDQNDGVAEQCDASDDG
jgi:hypothetical protein